MKNNKGITIMMLIITIIILVMLAGTTAYISDRITKQVKVENVKTNMLLIQAHIKTIGEKHTFDDANELVGTLETIDTEKYGVESDKEYYLLSEQDLIDLNLSNIEYLDGYYVCYDTEEVIFIRGVKNSEGKVLYTLTQMKEENV